MAPCRFDWHQTGSQVIISIYAKNAIPDLSYVDANSTRVRDTLDEFKTLVILLFVCFSNKSPLCPSAQHSRGI